MAHSWLIVRITPSPPPRICSNSFSSIGFVNLRISSLMICILLFYYEQHVNRNCHVFIAHSWLIVRITPSPPPNICSNSFSSIGFVNLRTSFLMVFPPSFSQIGFLVYNIMTFYFHIYLVIFPTIRVKFTFLFV